MTMTCNFLPTYLGTCTRYLDCGPRDDCLSMSPTLKKVVNTFRWIGFALEQRITLSVVYLGRQFTLVAA
jgi:hypothetical protein